MFSFIAMVRRWLLSIHHGYCCLCYKAVPSELMAKQYSKRVAYGAVICKVCSAEKHRQWYRANTDRHKSYVNPELQRRAVARYRAKRKMETAS